MHPFSFHPSLSCCYLHLINDCRNLKTGHAAEDQARRTGLEYVLILCIWLYIIVYSVLFIFTHVLLTDDDDCYRDVGEEENGDGDN